MPPRNSDTKAFRPYKCQNKNHNTGLDINSLFYQPQDAINNEFNNSFQTYLAEKQSNGLDVEQVILDITKEDEDGDKRYVDKQWYRDRMRGIR